MPAKQDFQRRLESIEESIRKIETAVDPSIRATTRELVETLMELFGAGFERTIEAIETAGEPGQRIIDKLGRDELVSSLLVLYGLHPLSVETRARSAIEKVRPQIRQRGGEVELVGIQDGVVRVRIEAGGQGCGSSAPAFRSAVEDAVYAVAPDIAALIVEGVDEPGFISVEKLLGVQSSNGHSSVTGGKGSL